VIGSVGCSKADRHGLQLTTLLQRIGSSGWRGGEVDLQPLNSTVIPLSCRWGHDRKVTCGVQQIVRREKLSSLCDINHRVSGKALVEIVLTRVNAADCLK